MSTQVQQRPARSAARGGRDWPLIGVLGALSLILVALVVPHLFGWHMHDANAPLASAGWRPGVGPGTVPAVLLGAAAVAWGQRLAASLSWRRLLPLCYAAALGWFVSLATFDGWAGIGGILGRDDEYLQSARQVGGISALLHEFVSRVPVTAANPWPTHVAGHPPGALLFFVLLVRLGLGGGLAAGLVVVAVGATVPVAVLATLRRLDAEASARRMAPLLVFGPAAIWMAVSADAVFAAVAAWCLYLLARAAATGGHGAAGWGLLAGVLFGSGALLSYGFPVFAVLGAGVLVAARRIRPAPWALLGGAAVVLAFATAGFVWWEAYPVLRARYYAGAAADRPAAYWSWGDLAALCIGAGPVLGASVVEVARRIRARDLTTPDLRVVVSLAGAAVLTVAIADLSFMSKAEVERIWLPFMPWLLLGLALLPQRWRRRALAGQIVFALIVQALLDPRW